jgi:hypothetical protein
MITVSCYSQNKRGVISLNNINLLAFVMETVFVLCELNSTLYCLRQNSAPMQHSQPYQNSTIRPAFQR